METLHRMENYFGMHPVIGFAVSGAHVAVATIMQVIKSESPVEVHLPAIVMESLQAGAWATAILAGAFTCYGVYRTHHGKKKKR